MLIPFDPYLTAALLIGLASGIDGRIAGQKLAITTHMIAALIGFLALTSSEAFIDPANSFNRGLIHLLAALILGVAWLAQVDSLRSQEEPDQRDDCANHLLALVAGLGCAMQAHVLVICAIVEMYILFLRRAQADCEPMYSGRALRRARR